MNPKGTVIVTDAGRGSSIAIIRSLGRQGWRVLAADTDPASPGFRSKYVHDRLVLPDPRTHAQGFADAMARGIEEHKVDLVIPVTDESIHPLTERRAYFESKCRLAIASAASLEHVLDKARTLDLARAVDVPIPRTWFVERLEDLSGIEEELSWPLVIKPTISRRFDRDADRIVSYSVTYANSPLELRERLQRILPGAQVLLQEYVAGQGFGIEMLAHEGRPLVSFQHRRLAEIPITGGASAWRESVPLDPKLHGWAKKMVAQLKWTGLVMVEFKVGPEAAYLMEVNGRVWGSLPLATSCGVDFPAALADLLMDGSPAGPEQTDYPAGIRAYNLELMLSWIVQVLIQRRRGLGVAIPRRREAIPALIDLVNPRRRSDVFTVHDLAPGLADFRRIALKFFRKSVPGARVSQ